jgi:uncharacterized RDD family membrane protein YckC
VSDASNQRMFMFVRGKIVGPYTQDEMNEFRRQGHLTSSIPIWPEGSPIPDSVKALLTPNPFTSVNSPLQQGSAQKYASFGDRFIAAFIDGLILTVGSWIITFSFHALGLGFISMMINICGAAVYEMYFLTRPEQATPGKKMMKLTVQMEDRSVLIMRAILVRHFCKYLSAMILFVGYLLALFTSKKQTLHDLIAKTVVLSTK